MTTIYLVLHSSKENEHWITVGKRTQQNKQNNRLRKSNKQRYSLVCFDVLGRKHSGCFRKIIIVTGFYMKHHLELG